MTEEMKAWDAHDAAEWIRDGLSEQGWFNSGVHCSYNKCPHCKKDIQNETRQIQIYFSRNAHYNLRITPGANLLRFKMEALRANPEPKFINELNVWDPFYRFDRCEFTMFNLDKNPLATGSLKYTIIDLSAYTTEGLPLKHYLRAARFLKEVQKIYRLGKDIGWGSLDQKYILGEEQRESA